MYIYICIDTIQLLQSRGSIQLAGIWGLWRESGPPSDKAWSMEYAFRIEGGVVLKVLNPVP